MFYLFMKQKGHGCDYTIACGQKLIALKATTPETIHAEIARHLNDHSSSIIEKVQILTDLGPAEGLVFDVKAHYAAEETRQKEEDRQRQEAKERADLERLQKKYAPA